MHLASLALAAAVLATGCGDDSRMPSDGGRVDTGTRDSGMDSGTDSGPRMCTTDPDCDDSIACTSDACAVGNVCRNTPLDELCAEGERCVPGTGCRMGLPSECETTAECDDGSFCNGMEECLGPAGSRTCIPGTANDCDDGNDCTVDSCDSSPEVNGCSYDVAPGCDAGGVTFDAGVPCDAFETGDYAGTYTFRPAAASACVGTATYSITEVTFSVPGSLSVRADRFTLTQSPAPTDGTFDVTFSDGCGSYRLQGMFACADRWTATWTATFGGACGSCTDQNLSVRGSRR